MTLGSIDAAVVGGGPCGSFAAWTLAKLGVDVAVFEEHEEIGLPSHCAGHVSLNGLKRLGLRLPQRISENEIHGAVFYSPSGFEFKVARSSPVTCVLNRELLDKHLAELAMGAGARYFVGWRVTSPVLKSGAVSGVVVKRESARRTVTTRIVIDAEGCSSLFLKRVGLKTLDKSMVVNAIQAEVDHVDDIEESMVEVYLGQNYAPGFFSWIIPKRDGSAKVGLAVKAGDPREYLRRLMCKHPVASKKLRKSKILRVSMHPISLGGAIPQTYANGLLVVGDAASQVKPTTGGGLIFGLLCARIAGKVAYEAMENSDFSRKFLWRYQQLWKKAIGFELDVMRWLRKGLNRLSDGQIDKIIGLCSRFGISEVLEKAGDVDYEGSSLVRMIPYPAIPVLALYFAVCSLTSTNN
jgi:digeranylgeranylglycerophospholipid reductase